jgi:uncharacterized membrane protein YraQ (UPF0718 family)/YHS domain-containing protein
MDKIGSGLIEGWWMLFDTFWALLFGFVLSGAIQAFVTRKKMQSLLGDHKPATIAKASLFGIISSSCSYAASALAHSIYRKGADFTASMVFMFASTNLVIELGIVLWLLIGWQFALAEFVGGAVMIALLTILIPRVISTNEESITPATPAAIASQSLLTIVTVNNEEYRQDQEEITEKPSLRSRISASAGYTIGDLTMLRVELIIGFVVAGLAMKVIPFSFWKALFISGHGFWSALENAIIGPFLAFISFVCSVGNVPLAAALWGAGITFGGVIAFIFADLISFPLVMIYRKYYGNKVALKLTLLFWFVMSVSGLITEGIFTLLRAVPAQHNMVMGSKHFGVNATTILNAIALILALAIYYFYKNPPVSVSNEFAQDPICGMQVRTSDAPASLLHDGVMYYFCMQGCKESFISK